MFRHLAWLGLLARACVFAGFEVVFAANAVSTAIDVSPFLNQVVVPFVVTLLGTLGAWVLLELRKHLGLQATSPAVTQGRR